MDRENNEDTCDSSMPMISDRCCSINLSTNVAGIAKPAKLISEKAQMSIDFQDVTFSVPFGNGGRKEILREVSGRFRPGRLTAIIGPSGAGKTSLLGYISGARTANFVGLVKVNGRKIEPSDFRRQVCYVPQEFAFLPTLTTKETLYVAARLKLSCNSQAANSVVIEIAESLGLATCLNTLVAQLSGGEKKRLSIGVEIVTNPRVLLLDEPTSGLDSVASIQVISVLKSMTNAGCTAVCAIHQPSSQMVELFDDVMVLSGGRNFYCGSRDNVVETFSAAGYVCPRFYNIAEFVLEVVTGQRDGNLRNLLNLEVGKFAEIEDLSPSNETDGRSTMDDDFFTANHEPKISARQKLSVLFFRAILNVKRDNTLTILRFCAHVAVAILLGMVYYDFGRFADKAMSNVSAIFFFLLFLFFSNSMPAVQMFPVEATVFIREHSNNWYPLKFYYFAKVTTDLLLQILCPTVFFGIVVYMTGQPLECEIVMKCWSICVLLTILGQSVGIATGAACDTQVGVFLIPALSIPMLIFSGFFLKLDEVQSYLQPLSTVSFFRYAFEGMLQAIYSSDRELICTDPVCLFRAPKQILSTLRMSSGSFQTIIFALCSWIVVLQATAFAVLFWRVQRRRK